MNPRVIGLDLSLTATGIASSSGWCDTIGDNGITKLPLRQRDRAVCDLADRIANQISLRTDLVVVESPAYSRARGGAHERAALWWRVVHRLHNQDIPVAEVLPTMRALYATGRANAGKTHVVDAVARRWPAWPTEGDENRADAMVLMAMGCDHLDAPLCTMPAKHRTALDRVAWPEMAVAS